ncbi:MAG: DUF4296 domain-containing protein [Bacteroidota bacterium]|nr:DUF4296 domain-containing protein [Bacteroidota bacterium]
MKKLTFIFILLLALSACKNENAETNIPPDVIPREKMQNILVDMQLVEGALIYERSQGGVSDSLRDYYFNRVFEKYAISSKQYDKSLNFYKDHLKLFDEMYNQVIKDLESLENQ